MTTERSHIHEVEPAAAEVIGICQRHGGRTIAPAPRSRDTR
jgi:hypothetical protein